MIRFLLILTAIAAATASPVLASEELRFLEEISRQYLGIQPSLRTYEVRVQTDKLKDMLHEMTADMPGDSPQPEMPTLKKYWSIDAGRSTIRMETDRPSPSMAKMVQRFSHRYNIDLKTFFMPPEGSAARKSLLDRASVKRFESQVEDARNLHISLEFSEPTDIDAAFFRKGLRIPHTDILAVALDLEPEKKLLHRVEIINAASVRYNVEIRHLHLESGHIPQEIRVTTADGTVDDRLATAFAEIDGFRLPTRQERTLRRNERQETVILEFTGYRVNIKLPAAVRSEFGIRTDGPS